MALKDAEERATKLMNENKIAEEKLKAANEKSSFIQKELEHIDEQLELNIDRAQQEIIEIKAK